MSTRTKEQIVQDHFKLKTPAIYQHEKAANGRFYWCLPPTNFDEWQLHPETKEEWQFNHCIVDDFGTLQPGNLFAHGLENEQFDEVIDYYLSGYMGAPLTDVARMERVYHHQDKFLIVDQMLNIYLVKNLDFFPTHIRLNCIQRGPWTKEPMLILQHCDIATSGFHYLLA